MTFLLSISSVPLAVAGVLLFVYMVWGFFIALYLKNNSIVDVAYGLGFILVAGTTLYNFGEHPLGGVATALVSVWGLRLAIRIHDRNRNKPEDFRYAAWRESWVWFKTRSFFQIFMLQGAIIWAIVSPVVIANSYDAPFLNLVSLAGLAVWCVGFFFEVVGDYQLDQFIKNPDSKGKLMKAGLWGYTRHPNYFGEATMWWGMWFLCLPAILPLGWWAACLTLLASPVLITFFLLKISGVPMLEAAMQKKPGWEEYANRVSVFVPWFPKH